MSPVETTCKPFFVVIHYLPEIFQFAVNYIYENFKMMSNTRMKTENVYRNLHATIGEHFYFA
jgi:hypothetical protein